MAVDARLLDCVAFVGEGNFVPMGTGFFVFFRIEKSDFYYFVTAAHNVWPRRNKRADNELPSIPISLRINRSNGGAPKVVPIPRSDWLFPEDRHVDVCALPIDIRTFDPTNELRIGSLNMESITITGAHAVNPDGSTVPLGLILGDELFILGAFVSHVGTKINIPVVRICNVSAMPLEPIAGGSPRHPAFLIETRSLGGISGSPVFMDQKLRGYPAQGASLGTDPLGKMHRIDVPYRLVGMVVGAHGGDYSNDFVAAEHVENDHDTQFNAGISVMLPVGLIESFLNSPRLKGAREATVTAITKQSG